MTIHEAIITELWTSGHTNAGATLSLCFYGKDDEANHYTLEGSAIGYTSIHVEADTLEPLAKDSIAWLNSYGVIIEATWESLLKTWEGLV